MKNTSNNEQRGQNFAAALLPQYGHLRVVAAQNAGVPIYFVIFFHIRLSSHIRERLASAHGLMPSRFFLVIVRLVAEGDLFRTLLPQELAVPMLVHGGGIPHGSSIDVPLNYADYYFLEALVRKTNIENGLPPVK